MAGIRNLVLTVGQGSGGLDFAAVEYDVFFTNKEIELDMPFGEKVVLLEQDRMMDIYLAAERVRHTESWWSPDELIATVPNIGAGDDWDDYIGIIYEGSSLSPGGRQRAHRSHRRSWEFPSQAGIESYRALVRIEPAVFGSWLISPKFEVDTG